MSTPNETKIAQELNSVKRAQDIYELAKKVNGEVKEIVQGEQWCYGIIVTKTNIQIVKFSPKTKYQLYTRGYIAITFEDAKKVLEKALEITKETLRRRLLEKAKELGIEL